MSLKSNGEPETFQRATHIILVAVKWRFALIYLENIVIYAKLPPEYVGNVRTVLSLLNVADATWWLKKFKFFTEKVKICFKSYLKGAYRLLPVQPTPSADFNRPQSSPH